MTDIRAMRLALGLTLEDVSELLECSKGGVSVAERNKDCEGIKRREAEFLAKVFNALSSEDKQDVLVIMNSLIIRENKKSDFKAKTMEVKNYV